MTPPPPPLASEPLSSPQPSLSPTRSAYRPPRPLPFELAQQVLIYFEESLYTQAFSLLSSLLFASTPQTSSSVNSLPAFVPSPAHLALASTIAVHPALTTKTTNREKHEQANAGLSVCRLTLGVVGPAGGALGRAWAFRKFEQEGRGKRDEAQEEEDEEDEKIVTPFSGAGSLYERAEDFWHVVGWALNCACLRSQEADRDMYKNRWELWHVWLRFMLDVLEEDIQIRSSARELSKSLIWQYISTAAGGHGRDRRIMRAVFADGSKKCVNEFPEIFREELRAPKPEQGGLRKRQVERVNVDAEVYGDYLDGDEDDEGDEGWEGDAQPAHVTKRRRLREPSSRRITPRNSGKSLRDEYGKSSDDAPPSSSTNDMLGGYDSLSLRLRLLHLLTSVSLHLPAEFMELSSLYTLFVEFIRPLPLPVFALLVIPSSELTAVFTPDEHTTLCEMLLQRLLEPAAPTVRSETLLTQSRMEAFYLPYAANKAGPSENAKASLLVEGILRYLAIGERLQKRDGLEDAIEKGIEKREEKALNDGRRGSKQDQGVEWKWLVESGERMRDVVRRIT